MSNPNEALKTFKESGAKYLDLRFTDVKGKWQHLTMDGTVVDADFLNEGTFFDGSSIAGWKPINESDMVLKPDLSTLVMDPFTAQPTMMLFCDILDAVTKEPYERDPRGTAKKSRSVCKI
jgi:glutamine synthetase